jgi:hypothetical protein
LRIFGISWRNGALYSILLYVGLPGSGKTYWAKKMCDVVIDDITDISQLPSSEILGPKDLGITDVNFCNDATLTRAIEILKGMYPSHSIGVSYFENDLDKCVANVIYRDDGRAVDGTLRRFSKIYHPPPHARKVWQPKIGV